MATNNRRLTKVLIKRVSEFSSKAFYMAANKVFKESNIGQENYAYALYKIRHGSFLHEFSELKEKVDAIYLEHLATLKTKDLEELIFAHERGAIDRSPRTIEYVASELMRRSLGDSQESDLIYKAKDNDVFGPYMSANNK